MKLIMESWRGYLYESDREVHASRPDVRKGVIDMRTFDTSSMTKAEQISFSDKIRKGTYTTCTSSIDCKEKRAYKQTDQDIIDLQAWGEEQLPYVTKLIDAADQIEKELMTNFSAAHHVDGRDMMLASINDYFIQLYNAKTEAAADKTLKELDAYIKFAKIAIANTPH
jgi:hypothetical protein